MAKAKITVIKKVSMTELYGGNPPAPVDENRITPECSRFELGQEFVVENHNCPPDFCNWAYADIQRDLAHILYGGYYPWMKEKDVAISCCTDGLRPVIFKIERLDD